MIAKERYYGGGIINGTYGTHKKYIHFPICTNKIWSCLLWSPVIVDPGQISDGVIPKWRQRRG